MDQQKAAQKSVSKTIEADALVELVPLIGPVRIERIAYEAKRKFNLGEKKVRTLLDILVSEQKVFRHKFPRPGTNDEIKYARTKQTV